MHTVEQPNRRTRFRQRPPSHVPTDPLTGGEGDFTALIEARVTGSAEVDLPVAGVDDLVEGAALLSATMAALGYGTGEAQAVEQQLADARADIPGGSPPSRHQSGAVGSHQVELALLVCPLHPMGFCPRPPP